MRKLILLVALCLPAVCQAWWSDDWNFRKEISFDLSAAGANIPGTVQDVPVLIRLHAGNYGYFGDTKPDGSDFRFVDGDDKTPLKFHIERFDPVNQLAFIWVRVPRLAAASNAQKIFLYYGNAKAPAASDAAGTYDKSQALVLHFSGDEPSDVSAAANKPSASTAEMSAASLIAGGAKFNGSQSIAFPAGGALHLQPGDGAAMSTWARIETPQGDAYVLALEDQGAEFVLGMRGARPYARLSSTAGKGEAVSTEDVSTAQWHHLAASYSSGKLLLYVDGTMTASVDVKAAAIGGQLTVGAARGGAHGYRGELDEVEFSNSARSADWISVAARSQGVDGRLVAYGGDAQREAQKVSYFKVTLQNVTADGWAVIGVLAVMFVIALLVMTSKAIFLARVRGSNARFLKDFEAALDPAALEVEKGSAMPAMAGDSRYGASNIYQLYLRGMLEVSKRFNGKSAGAAAVTSLTPQAIDAMRASMDAVQVRLTQKLSANMVLLTIAIAGGPFLGLLGTVVGVMITFAAIAASGDVNVNAIAPGIAAALVATVAGLGVAIPSLFGYNWLNTRIKNVSADMRVFVDEFITRMAEQHAD